MLWKELVEVVGIPFIKVELLRDNPHSISDVMAWRSVVHARSPELIPMIERHLSRDRQDWIHNSRVICFSRLITKESFMRRDFRLDRLGKLIKKRLNRRAFEIAMKSYRSMRDGFGLRSTDKTVGEHR